MSLLDIITNKKSNKKSREEGVTDLLCFTLMAKADSFLGVGRHFYYEATSTLAHMGNYSSHGLSFFTDGYGRPPRGRFLWAPQALSIWRRAQAGLWLQVTEMLLRDAPWPGLVRSDLQNRLGWKQMSDVQVRTLRTFSRREDGGGVRGWVQVHEEQMRESEWTRSSQRSPPIPGQQLQRLRILTFSYPRLQPIQEIRFFQFKSMCLSGSCISGWCSRLGYASLRWKEQLLGGSVRALRNQERSHPGLSWERSGVPERELHGSHGTRLTIRRVISFCKLLTEFRTAN